MKHLMSLTIALVACLALAACGDHSHDEDHGHGHGHDDHDHATKNGGILVETSDHAMHFEVLHDVGAGLLQVWIYDGDMDPVTTSAPMIQLSKESGSKRLTGMDPKGGSRAHEWHFSDRALTRVVQGRMRLEHDGKNYNIDLPEGDHEHGHGHGHGHGHDEHHGHGEHGPHDGMVAAFAGPDGKEAGHIELKLHDDKGDLELWIATDKGITKPYDLPLDATVTVTFHDKGDKQIALAVRNKDTNEDEDGKANVRDGKTNYFIFPGDTGADAFWLMGKKFMADVSVSFEDAGATYRTEQFVLMPHSHHEGHGHGHDDDHDGHHGHGEHGPHDGIVTAFTGMDGKGGYVELKLHDDKGDLELWLATDEGITTPFDLPLDATLTVTFHDKNKAVTLAVRNKDKNEDEDGKANNRDGKTNYFIFPGDTGADASWLMGKAFKAQVSVSFASGAAKYATKQFTLLPHTHADGHAHK